MLSSRSPNIFTDKHSTHVRKPAGGETRPEGAGRTAVRERIHRSGDSFERSRGPARGRGASATRTRPGPAPGTGASAAGNGVGGSESRGETPDGSEPGATGVTGQPVANGASGAGGWPGQLGQCSRYHTRTRPPGVTPTGE
jgi:hypothetical protein